MRRGRVFPAVIAMSSAVACSEPTDVQPLAQQARVSVRPLTNANVVHVASADRGVMGVFGNVTVYGSGYGSAVACAPHGSRDFYLLTDRGPNVDFPAGNKGFKDSWFSMMAPLGCRTNTGRSW